MPNTGTVEAIERAKTYPFRQPRCSYIFTHDHEHLLDGHRDTWKIDLGGLTPVFGYGSNPSPVALAHKFATTPEVHIPVIAFEIEGYDAVYSSHISAGYIPATIHPSPNTRIQGFMTYLTGEQLETMDASESRGVNYELVELDATGRFEDGTEMERPLTYVSLHGLLEIEGGLRAVPGTEAKGRQFEEMAQSHVLGRVIDTVAPEMATDQFIGTAIASATQRKAWTGKLKESDLRADQ